MPAGTPECRELIFLKPRCLEDGGSSQSIFGRETLESTAHPIDHASANSGGRALRDHADMATHEETGTFHLQNKKMFWKYHREEHQPLVVPSVRCRTAERTDRNPHIPSAGVGAKKVAMVQTLPQTGPDVSGLNVEGHVGNRVEEGYAESSIVVASLRAGDWVLLERNSSISSGSCGKRSGRVTGWLRVEAVSIG